jgi:hypothetical protein
MVSCKYGSLFDKRAPQVSGACSIFAITRRQLNKLSTTVCLDIQSQIHKLGKQEIEQRIAVLPQMGWSGCAPAPPAIKIGQARHRRGSTRGLRRRLNVSHCVNCRRQSDVMGQDRPICCVGAMSASHPTATKLLRRTK